MSVVKYTATRDGQLTTDDMLALSANNSMPLPIKPGEVLSVPTGVTLDGVPDDVNVEVIGAITNPAFEFVSSDPAYVVGQEIVVQIKSLKPHSTYISMGLLMAKVVLS